MKKRCILALILILSLHHLFAQKIQNSFENKQSGVFQKLYLQTDRTFYFVGDTIWFSGYLLDGKTHIPINGHQNLHVDLIDSLGTVITNKVFPVLNGFSEGNIPLSDTCLIGHIAIRAYTNYLRNFGDEHFFYKPITIDKTKNSFEVASENNPEYDTNATNIQVEFYPEGGILLENKLNTVVAQISDSNGQSINTSGSVIDERDEIVAHFKTNYKGLGKFFFHPNPDKKYKVILDVFPQQKYNFITAEKSGIKLQIVENDNNGIDVNIISNSTKNKTKNYTVACMHRNELKFYQSIKLNEDGALLKVNKNLLGEGINRFVLLNNELNPVSERLYFNNTIEINTLRISLPKFEYANRKQVKFTLDLPQNAKPDSARLSIAVVNENSLNAFGEKQNILSQLYLDSELRGTIESPLDYFRDDAEFSSAQKLDLLMLTQGWSKYIWNQILEPENTDFKFPIEAGMKISGYVENLFGKKRVENSEVILFIRNDSLFTFVETTDENGCFSFEHLFLTDSAEITLQARKSNESENTEIILNPLKHNIPGFDIKWNKQLFISDGIPMILYRQNYYARLREKEFEPEKDVILIDEVEVKAKYTEKEEVKFSQIYSEPDYLIKTTDADFIYENVREFLFAKAPLMFGARPPSSLKMSGEPLFLIDGIPVDGGLIMNRISLISVANIDRVDIIKRTNPTGTALYGTRGANGVVLIYTKKGIPNEEREKYLKGVISAKVKGFSKYREFYSPKYTSENVNSEKPDHRTTLYWNPSVILENGKAEISFFTSDDIARYKVLVEGISSRGTILLGEASFDVTPENN